MAIIRTGVPAHDAALLAAEAVRMAANVPGATQAALKAADVVYARAALSSCKTNNNNSGSEQFLSMLRELGFPNG
jgi:hypothetical protein